MTNSLVVCFSGRIRSGKTSVSKEVAQQLGAAWISFGGFIRSIAEERSLDINRREVLQNLGEQLIRENGAEWLCSQVILSAHWDGSRPLVIDGIRHVEVLNIIIRLLNSSRVVLIYLDYDGESENIRGIDSIPRQVAEQHSTEYDVLHHLPSRANLIVSTDQPVDNIINIVFNYLGAAKLIK